MRKSNWESFPRDRVEHKKYLSCHHQEKVELLEYLLVGLHLKNHH